MDSPSLATVKNPPVFAKQANINNGGQQQVNNGAQPAAAPAADTAIMPTRRKSSAIDSVEIKR